MLRDISPCLSITSLFYYLFITVLSKLKVLKNIEHIEGKHGGDPRLTVRVHSAHHLVELFLGKQIDRASD